MAGVSVVLTEKFDAETTLATIEKYRVTHTHMVATMFQRLLALPADVRARYDLSSLRCVVHGAAPTPPAVKRAMMDWWGPILDEYYGASEGSGGFYITAAEWLKKPGSVGRCLPEWGSRVVNEKGEDCAPGEIGRVFFRFEAGAPFRYYKDASKTESISLNGTHFTVGDLGYLDADGYLFLTGRSAECIISGGVNIYPQDIDHVLLKHPAVAEACAVGAPNDEWGEEVKAVVVLRPDVTPDPQLSAEIMDFVRSHVAAFKAPRSVDFVPQIPRSEAGKILRNAVRARYWEGRGRQI
jgi:long-chain acyl-CoA synthetase